MPCGDGNLVGGVWLVVRGDGGSGHAESEDAKACPSDSPGESVDKRTLDLEAGPALHAWRRVETGGGDQAAAVADYTFD